MTCKPEFVKDVRGGKRFWACLKGCYPIACMTPRHRGEARAFEVFEPEFHERRTVKK